MRILYRLFGFKINAITLIAAATIMLLILATNLTVTKAQQQQEGEQQLLTSQPASPPLAQNGTLATTLFESTLDSFQVQLPEGWVVQDVNNTGFTLAAEATEGYGILAQLCPAEEREEEEERQQQQQQGALTDVTGSSSGGCQQQQQQGQQEIIHIIRYPNLGARLGIAVDDIADVIPDSVLNYQIGKLQEVGYRNINISNNTVATIPINYTAALDVPATGGVLEATVPARFVEMTYSTDSAPTEMRGGYLFLTATNAVPPNEMITGYSLFYEGAAAGAEETIQSASLLPLSPAAARILASFELIASAEVALSVLDVLAQQLAVSNEPNDQVEEAAEEEAGEEAEDDDE